MKQIVCEMCGSNKMTKKNGIYECQYCGCQYTVEEARKLIVEGTVKIDESDRIVNWVKLADSAYNNSNWKEAYLYYCKVLEVYPDEWRSIYRKGLTIGWQSSLANIHVNETLGGISDGFKVLLAADNNDAFKAWGILSMEHDLLSWLTAVHKASAKHASEYTDTLESACYEYYKRSILMASVVEFAISLLNKFAVINIEDIDLADGSFGVIVSASDAISMALSSKFRPLVGKRYSTFWQAYFDDYRNISPTEDAIQARSNLRAATEKLKRVYPIWKHERLLKDNPDYDREIMYKEAWKKKKADDIQSLKEAADLFEKTSGYKDSGALAEECRERIKEKNYTIAVRKKNADNISSLNAAVTQFENMTGYKDSDLLVEECRERIREKKYEVALENKQTDSLKSLSEATAQFEELSDYKDSIHLACECKDRINELTHINERKRKSFVAVGIVAIAVAIFIILVTKLSTGSDTKIAVASLDMSTSLIEDGKMIPANRAYELLKERMLKRLGIDYTFYNSTDGIVGFLKRGEGTYRYGIACMGLVDFIKRDGTEIPEKIIIYDFTNKEPNVETLSMFFDIVLDNPDSSKIETILKEQKEKQFGGNYPETFSILLNKKLFIVTSGIKTTGGGEGAYALSLFGDYYDIDELDPKTALSLLFVNDDTINKKLLKLTNERKKELLDYYYDHAQNYYKDFDSFVEEFDDGLR